MKDFNYTVLVITVTPPTLHYCTVYSAISDLQGTGEFWSDKPESNISEYIVLRKIRIKEWNEK